MSKYNVGDKFMIEIDKVVKGFSNDADKLYRIKGFNSLVFDEYGLDKLLKTPVTLHTDRELNNAKKEAYEAGLNEAWELAKTIYFEDADHNISYKNLVDIFKCGDLSEIMKHKPQEVKAKIEAWKKEQKEKEKIHVGDVVHHKENKSVRLVVTAVYGARQFDGIKISPTDIYGDLFGLYEKRSCAAWEKTGQHFDLNEIFQVENEEEFPFN